MARTDRERFLATVRAAQAQGAGYEGHASLPTPRIDAQEEPDLVARFAREAEAADCAVTRAASPDEARATVREILQRRGARHIVRGDTPLVRALGLDAGFDVTACSASAEREELRAAAAGADAGVTEADFGIAESGTLALLHRPGQGRAVSLLPPLHVALLRARDIVPELGALFGQLDSDDRHPASALTFVTGPSRTGDIEFVLTRGVHGPEAVHVVLLEGDS